MHDFITQLRLAFPELFQAANHDGAPVCEHRRRVDERVKRFRRQVRSESYVEVEVTAGTDGRVDKGADGLVLEDIFVTVQQIDRIERCSALLEVAKERIEGERRHPAKLSRLCARRKAPDLRNDRSRILERHKR